LMGRRPVGVLPVATLGALALVCSGAAPVASARVADDPCDQNPLPHITANGLHCGGIFGVPGHQTAWTPEKELPPACAKTEDIPGFGNIGRMGLESAAHTAKWDYWTGEGRWVLWDGGFDVKGWERWVDRSNAIPRLVYPIGGGQRPQQIYAVTQIRPRFHNWSNKAWPVRVYFHCQPLPARVVAP
jgi:hypothetical protein